MEYAFTNNWIIGAEYLYYDLGSRHLNIVPKRRGVRRLGSGRLLPNEDQLQRLGRPRPDQLQVLIPDRAV